MKYFLPVIVLIFFAACGNKPEFPDKPTIQYESVSSTYIIRGDSLLINISFTDGDGNIGIPDGYMESNRFLVDSPNGFVLGKYDEINNPPPGASLQVGNLLFTNSLDGKAKVINTPEIPNKGNVKSISGTITLIIPFAICHQPNLADFDTVSYSIQLLDRAENYSNTVSTPPIIYQCD